MKTGTKKQFIQDINRITTDAMTNLSGGMILAKDHIFKNIDHKFDIHRVLVLTDGQTNEGITDTTKLHQLQEQLCSNIYRACHFTCLMYGLLLKTHILNYKED